MAVLRAVGRHWNLLCVTPGVAAHAAEAESMICRALCCTAAPHPQPSSIANSNLPVSSLQMRVTRHAAGAERSLVMGEKLPKGVQQAGQVQPVMHGECEPAGLRALKRVLQQRCTADRASLLVLGGGLQHGGLILAQGVQQSERIPHVPGATGLARIHVDLQNHRYRLLKDAVQALHACCSSSASVGLECNGAQALHGWVTADQAVPNCRHRQTVCIRPVQAWAHIAQCMPIISLTGHAWRETKSTV